MSGADKILSSLTRVKRTASGKWSACCPAHEDKSPSLNIRELEDGRLLLHCFGGCTVEEVVGSIGLGMEDLFPPRDSTPGAGTKPQRRPFNAVDLIDLAAWEASVVCVIASDIFNGIPDADIDRLMEAAGRLGSIAEAIHAR